MWRPYVCELEELLSGDPFDEVQASKLMSQFLKSNVQEYYCYILELLNFWALFFLSHSKEYYVSEVASVSFLGLKGWRHLLCWIR
jgi:hypothetical protein